MLEKEDHDDGSRAPVPPTFQRALLAGAISGVAVDFILFPLDTIKTRVQSSQGFVASGGFKGVYRGVGSVGFGSAPGAAAFFVTYETLKKHAPKLSSSLTTSSSMTHLLAATGGEFISCLIRVPTEIVKSRTQTGAYGPGKSSWHSLVQTMRYEGIRGFYRGFGITIARELPFTSLQFPLYEALKGQLSKRYLDGKRPSPGQAAICGSIAGGFAGAVTCPLDVVKTRVMLEAKTAMPAADGTRAPRQPSPSVLSFGPRLAQIFRNEGFAALFAGWIPRTSAIATGGAVFLGIYDFAINFGKDNPSEAVEKVV